MKTSACAWLLGFFLASAWAVGGIPPPPPGMAALPVWRELDSQKAVDRLFHPVADTPQAIWDDAGFVRLPVVFKGTRLERVSWDIPISADLRRHKGVAFDFYCQDLPPVTSFSLYFRSGSGWYHASFFPEATGVWSRVVVDKADTRIEGEPDGWGRVDRIRLSGWRGGDRDTVCAIAHLGPAGDPPVALVARAESLIRQGGSESQAYGQFATTLSDTFDRLGLAAVQVADMDMDAAILEGISLVALPYNPSLPESAVDVLRGFVAQGGRLLVCFSLEPTIAEALGLRQRGGVEAAGGPFVGYARTARGLPHQPVFAPQASWRTTVVEPAEGRAARVLAVWRHAASGDTEIPAVTLTPTGAFFGHVWFAGAEEVGVALMRAVVGELMPDMWRQAARASFAAIGAVAGARDFEAFQAAFPSTGASEAARRDLARAMERRDEARRLMGTESWPESIERSQEAADAALQAWMRTHPSARGEHRAFWCHSPFGLGERDWDASIRFLRDHGFTAILPNMLWAGLAFYPSEVLPVYEDLATRGDPLAQCLAACRRYGVACHVWKVNWNTGGKAPRAFLDRMRNEGRIQRRFDGTWQETWLCPTHPANQDLEVAAMVEVARKYDVDGIHFDYIRYPDNETCYCAGCRGRFEAVVGRAISRWPEDTREPGALRQAWLDFRRAAIDTVVRRVAEEARAVRPGVQISAAVFSNWPVDRDLIGQDWRKWCEAGWLDFVCPMNYTDSNLLFRNMVAMQKGFVGQARLYPGIGLSCWQTPNDAVKLAQQIGVARELGLSGFTVFNYDRHAEIVLPYLRLGVAAE